MPNAMTFEEATEILEMVGDGDPRMAKRAYLLMLQKNGPEVPPDVYDRLTEAYDVLKEEDVWPEKRPAPQKNRESPWAAGRDQGRRGRASDGLPPMRRTGPRQPRQSTEATPIREPLANRQRKLRGRRSTDLPQEGPTPKPAAPTKRSATAKPAAGASPPKSRRSKQARVSAPTVAKRPPPADGAKKKEAARPVAPSPPRARGPRSKKAPPSPPSGKPPRRPAPGSATKQMKAPSEAALQARVEAGPVRLKKQEEDVTAVLDRLSKGYPGVFPTEAFIEALNAGGDNALSEPVTELLEGGHVTAFAAAATAFLGLMAGKSERRWWDPKSVVELILRLNELVEEDVIALEAAQGVRRALSRWRQETEDARIVFPKATMERWTWSDHLTVLPDTFPPTLRIALAGAIRMGDIREAVDDCIAFAKKKPEAADKARKILARDSTKLLAEFEGPLTPPKSEPGLLAAAADVGSRMPIPKWVVPAVFVVAVLGAAATFLSIAMDTTGPKDHLTYAKDAICSNVGGNRPACKVAREVDEAIHDKDCGVLIQIIPTFVEEVEKVTKLRGGLSAKSTDTGSLRAQMDVLVQGYLDACKQP